MIRSILLLLILLGGLWAGVAWLGQHPPPGGAAQRPVAPASPARPAAPSATAASVGTPFGDAVFRWRCTAGLLDLVRDRQDWPLRRLAGLCLCAAERLRAEGPRDIVLGAGEVADSLEAAEARLCRGS